MEPKSTRIRIRLRMLAILCMGLNFVELGVSLVRLLHTAKRVRISTYCYNFACNLCAVVPGGVGGGRGCILALKQVFTAENVLHGIFLRRVLKRMARDAWREIFDDAGKRT